MAAFDPLDSDIDRTPPGQPYVVSADGWGWFMIVFLLISPAFILSFFITSFAAFYIKYYIPTLLTYYGVALCFSAFFYYRKKYKCHHPLCGIIATLCTITPLALIITCYAVPIVTIEPGFDSTLDFALFTVLLSGIAFFIFSISKLVKNGLTHLILSILFLVVSIILLQLCIKITDGALTANIIASIYFS